MKDKTVMINGRAYDAATGLPVEPTVHSQDVVRVRKTPQPRITHEKKPEAEKVHSPLQRSQTLNRHAVRKNAPPRNKGSMDIAHISKSSSISRFAPHAGTPAKSLHASEQVTRPDHPDHGPVVHPMAARASARRAAPALNPQEEIPAAIIKKNAIDMALSAPSPSKKLVKKKSHMPKRRKRLITTIIVAVIIVIIGGTVVFFNIPALSVAIAGSQAGISASYPSYTPDGYSLKQPISFSQGQVNLQFVGNGNGKGYTITEQQSSWDSSAVLENVVEKAVGTNYLTIQDNGLTIYSYGGNAAWVNNGILYTIKNAAPLSNQQLQSIATSL